MRMSRKQTPISTQYELSGQVLEEVKDANYLGVTVSDDLEWTKHINAITTKANSKLSFLRRNIDELINNIDNELINNIDNELINQHR